MKLRSTIVIMQLVLLAACGGSGDSDSGAGAEENPPATPQNENDEANPGNSAEESPLTLTCSGTPASGLVQASGQVSANFQFSQSVNGPATVLAGENGKTVMTENVFVNGNQFIVNRKASATGAYSIRLSVTGTELSEVCTWTIVAQGILANG